MPNPTRAQIEAFLATLPPDQQGPALEEIKRRMMATSTGSPTPDPFWSRAVSGDPHTAAASQMTGSDMGRAALTAGGLGAAYAVPAAVGAAIPALAAYPAATAAVGGGAAAAVEGAGLKGILFGALTGGALTKIGKLWRVAKMLGLVGKPAAAEAGALTQAEMQQVVKQLARGEPGAVVNPTVEEVAAKMVPRGELPPLSQSEMLAVLKGAAPRGTSVSAVGKTMTAAGELPPMTQGEMTTVARGVSRPPSGWVENPSPEMVAKYMQRPVPAGVDADAVAALQKWDMSFDDAVRLAAKASPAAPIATPSVASATALTKEEARARLGALFGKTVREGRIAAASTEAAKGNRQLAEKILGDLQGEGVLAP